MRAALVVAASRDKPERIVHIVDFVVFRIVSRMLFCGALSAQIHICLHEARAQGGK